MFCTKAYMILNTDQSLLAKAVLELELITGMLTLTLDIIHSPLLAS